MSWERAAREAEREAEGMMKPHEPYEEAAGADASRLNAHLDGIKAALFTIARILGAMADEQERR